MCTVPLRDLLGGVEDLRYLDDASEPQRRRRLLDPGAHWQLPQSAALNIQPSTVLYGTCTRYFCIPVFIYFVCAMMITMIIKFSRR